MNVENPERITGIEVKTLNKLFFDAFNLLLLDHDTFQQVEKENRILCKMIASRRRERFRLFRATSLSLRIKRCPHLAFFKVMLVLVIANKLFRRHCSLDGSRRSFLLDRNLGPFLLKRLFGAIYFRSVDLRFVHFMFVNLEEFGELSLLQSTILVVV